jgi:hypothetical protein
MPRPSFRLEDVVGVFRALEQNDDALVVLGDETAMRVAVAWSHTDQEWERPPRPQPAAVHGKMGGLWSWMVSGWNVDARAVARLAGVPRTVAHAKLEMLIGNRLIYPDGSMAKGMRSVLLSYAARKLGIKQQLPAQPRRARAEDDDDEGN